MKFKVIFISIIATIIIILTGCNEVEKEYAENTTEGVIDKYNVSTETYILEDDRNNIRIEYPVISGLSDESKQKDINELILVEALKVYNDYDYEDRGHLELDVKFNTVLEDESILSIQYFGLGNVENTPHPNKLFYTTNIDMITGSRLRLANLINIEDDFINMFIDSKFKYDGPLDVDPDLDIYETHNIVKEEFISADNMGSIFSYLTDDSLGISISVAHAAGGYALFKIEYSEIEKFVIDDSEGWNIFFNKKNSN